MVSPLKHYSKDPMGKGRGSGLYYQRSYKHKKTWQSKYSEARDAKINSHKGIGGKYKHAGDANKSRHV